MGYCTIILLVGCAIGGLILKNYMFEIFNPLLMRQQFFQMTVEKIQLIPHLP